MDYDMTTHHNPDAQAWAKFFIETQRIWIVKYLVMKDT